MEEQIPQTPMGRIWVMILMSALFVFSVSWIWHLTEMQAIETRDQKDDEKTKMNMAYLAAYRDVLQAKGKEAARVYLEQLQKTPYGI